MDLDLKEVLNTASPTATLVFAAWIFMQLVSMRMQSAFDRCQALGDELRRGQAGPERQRDIHEQLRLHGDRGRLLQRAMAIGMVAAIFLILTLAGASLSMAFRQLSCLKYLTLGCSLFGLLLLLVAVALMLRENGKMPRALESDSRDLG